MKIAKTIINSILTHFNRGIYRLDDKRVIRVDYDYHPIPRLWTETAGVSRIRDQMIENESKYGNILSSFSRYLERYEDIPLNYNGDETSPYWLNNWLPVFDSITIYGLLATRNPSVYFEIGSGNSTKFARRAILDNDLRTRIISLDPQPRASIDSLCDEIIRTPCEDAPISLFEKLPNDTIFFADNSHRSFQNSDVTVFFTEILPSLPRGCIWGLHDISLPYDYSWEESYRYYNEQYLLLVYLLGGGGDDSILLPNAFISTQASLSQILADTIFSSRHFHDIDRHGSCFWMIRDS